MRFTLLVAVGALIVALGAPASPARAQRATGFRLVGTTGWTRSGGVYGFALALDRVQERDVHVDMELAYQHISPYVQNISILDSSRSGGTSSLTTLLAGLDMRAPIRGHTSPFLRGAFGPAWLRTADMHVVDTYNYPPRSQDIQGGHVFGLAVRGGFGFGRLPCEGLGWEAGLHLTQFLGSGHELTCAVLETGFVY